MVRMETPVCDFGRKPVDFALPGVDGRNWSLEQCRGPNGLLVMFICNHCPYVKAIRERIVRDTLELKDYGVGAVAIMSNDPSEYPEDSLDNMKIVAEQFRFPFPYLLDESQQVAKAYGAVCTPDFFATTPTWNCNIAAGSTKAARTPPPTACAAIYSRP